MSIDTSFHAVTLSLDSNEAEMALAVIYDLGCLGLEELDDDEGRLKFKTYFPGSCPLDDLLQRLKASVPRVTILHAVTAGLNAQPFRPAPFEPFQLVGDVWVVPPDDLGGGKDVTGRMITIRPGPAFGTGRHTTTRLVAEAFLNLGKSLQSVLDLGTGSGILAILARLMGVPRVDAVEISDEARRNASENFGLSGFSDIRLFEDLKEVNDRYEVVLANVLATTLLHLKDEIVKRVAPGGAVILSGITREEEGRFGDSFGNLPIRERTYREEWCCLVCGAVTIPTIPR